jgi:hypothetical protein
MSAPTPLEKLFQSVKAAPGQIFGYISSAALRIFSPNKDNYPATGAQPFEGDPADEK